MFGGRVLYPEFLLKPWRQGRAESRVYFRGNELENRNRGNAIVYMLLVFNCTIVVNSYGEIQ